MIRSCLAAAFMLLSLALREGGGSAAQAAEITTYPKGHDRPTNVILIEGELIVTPQNDRGLFSFQAIKFHDQPAQVQLNSKGGQIEVGFHIGEIVRRRGWDTVVLRGNVCSSACALIWLSGRQRYLEVGAGLGLHATRKDDAVYDPAMGRYPPNPEGDQAIATHLRELGFPDVVAKVFTATPNHQIRWMTAQDLRAASIGFIHFDRRSGYRKEFPAR